MINAFVASIIGTSVMTGFTMIWSRVQDTNFSEPYLLNKFFAEKTSYSSSSTYLGWIVHYFTGFSFALIYWLFFLYTDFSIGFLSWIILSVASSIAALGVWYGIFTLGSSKFPMRKSFFIHIIIAHFVFTAGALIGFELMGNDPLVIE